MPTVLGIAAGLFAGLLLGLAIWHRSRTGALAECEKLREQVIGLEKEKALAEEKISWLELAEEKLKETFSALSGDALRANMETLKEQAKGDLKGVIDPLKENLTSLDGHVRELEKARKGAYGELQQKLVDLGNTNARLQETTTVLSQALRSTTVRGRWGELELRRVVEMAGMTNRVSFDEQVSVDQGRPDMVVNLPQNAILPVDSKAPLNAYLEAMEENDPDRRSELLGKHAAAMRGRIKELGQKKYWDQFDESPDFVVMFVPNEACLGAAFDKDPGLLEYAFEQKVLITSPVNLLALLKTIAYGWQQQQISENAKKIAEEGKKLFDRIGKFVDHYATVGKHLNQSIHAYNKATGSLERRLIPAADRFRELGVSQTELEAPAEIDARASLGLLDSKAPLD